SEADAAKAYADAVRLLDRAGRKQLIHPNAAARHKSRLAKAVKGKE
ncbi:MAG: 30S ribosomal protein S20, partial [Gemmatimonadales bacterium]